MAGRRRYTPRLCERCFAGAGDQSNPMCPRCGAPLPQRFTMSGERCRRLVIFAKARKGLAEQDYRDQLAVVGVTSSKDLTRDQFQQLVNRLARLPDVPSWRR